MKFFTLLSLLLSFLLINPVFAFDNSASTVLSARLPARVEINGIIIDGRKTCMYKNPKLHIKHVTQIGKKVNMLELSNLQLDILSNSADPITMTADFVSLSNHKYSFAKSDLNVEPQKAEIRQSGISPVFRPLVKVGPEAEPGEYRGVITFTVMVL